MTPDSLLRPCRALHPFNPGACPICRKLRDAPEKYPQWTGATAPPRPATPSPPACEQSPRKPCGCGELTPEGAARVREAVERIKARRNPG